MVVHIEESGKLKALLSSPKVHISEQQQPTCDDQDDVLVDGGVLDVEHGVVVGHHHDDGLESL